MLTRRGFIGGLGLIIAAPAIVKASSLMQIRGEIIRPGGLIRDPLAPVVWLDYVGPDGVPGRIEGLLVPGRATSFQVGGRGPIPAWSRIVDAGVTVPMMKVPALGRIGIEPRMADLRMGWRGPVGGEGDVVTFDAPQWRIDEE